VLFLHLIWRFIIVVFCIVMRYSKKRRYRKKQRGGNETKTEFSYPESDMAYAQIYGLIQNEELRKSVIEEMTKGDEILFTSRDLTPKISPGIMDIGLYEIVVEAAEREVYNVNPELGPGVNTATGSYTSETFKNTILNKQYGIEQISVYYDNDDNLFLRHLIDAFYNSAEKTLAPSLQEKSFLKELFTSGDNQHTYIDSIFSSNGGTNTKIELIVSNDLVYSIVFKNLAGITGAKLVELDKLKGLKKITIQDDITKYSDIKSATVEDVIIETDSLLRSDQLLFLSAFPTLKKIAIKTKGLKKNIADVLNMLPYGETKTMVDLKGSSALSFGDITDIVRVIKDKKITGIAFPNQMTKMISDNNVALSEALKPRFLKSVFGQSVSVSTEKINESLVEKYSQLKDLFPDEFKIEEVPEGNDVKYTVYNGNEVGGQPVCEFATTTGGEANSRKLKTIHFKKGMTRIVLNGFNDLTQVSIDQDVELTEINITDCTNDNFNVVFLSKTGVMTTSQPLLHKIVITGCSTNKTQNKNNVFNLTKLDSLTFVEIDLLSISDLVLLDCNKLTEVAGLPVFLNRLEINDAPISNIDFLNSLETLMLLNLKGCAKFKELNLDSKGTLTHAYLNECISLQRLTLNDCSQLNTIEVKAPQKRLSNFKKFENDPAKMTLSKVEISDCTNMNFLELPPSVQTLIINNATLLDNTSFLLNLPSLNSLMIDNCPAIDSINCTAFEKKIQQIFINNCNKLTNIYGLVIVPNLTKIIIFNVSIQTLVLKGCTQLTSDNIKLPNSLQSLEISDAVFEKIDFLGDLRLNLESLKLTVKSTEIGFDGFISLSEIEIKGNNAITATISGCEKLSSIKLPSTLKSLLIDESSITSTRFLNSLTNLESLTITNSLQKYEVSDYLPATLKTLELENSVIDSTKNIFDKAMNLETIKITNDDTLAYINLSNSAKLTTLEFKECIKVTINEVSNLAKLTSIYIDDGNFTEFTINKCDALTSIHLPKKLTKLTINSSIAGFDFTELTTLKDFTSIDNGAVEEVVVEGPVVVDTNITSGPNIKKTDDGKIIIPTSVENLILNTNGAMTTIENMDGLKSTLKILTIDTCKNLQTELVFDGFDNLSHLNIDRCKNVKMIYIKDCKNLRLVNGLTDMTTLSHLVLENIASGASVLFSITEIDTLSIKGKNIRVTNNVGSNLAIAETFTMDGCILNNHEINITGQLKTLILKNCSGPDANNPIILTIKDSASLTTFELTNSDIGKIHVSNCTTLTSFPQITGMPNLTDLVLSNLPIEALVVSNCPKLTTVSHDKCIKITNIRFDGIGLTTIDILLKPKLAEVLINECPSLTDLNVSQNSVLTTLTMTTLTLLKTLNVINNGNSLTMLDFTGVPNVETLNIYSNKGLTTLQNIASLTECSTYILNNNAISMTLDDFLDTLNAKTDKNVFLDKNIGIKLNNVEAVVASLETKNVVMLYAAKDTSIQENQPAIYDYYSRKQNNNGFINTNFTSAVGGVVPSGATIVGATIVGATIVEIILLLQILAIPDTDIVAELTKITTLINDDTIADKKYNNNNSSATFTQVGGDYRITTLVLAGDVISFVNVKDLTELKTLTIQNNTTDNKDFNNLNSRVLPNGLKELEIIGCSDFKMVNLDNLKNSLITFKHNNANDMSEFSDFPNLATVELGEIRDSKIHFIRCPVLETVLLHDTTHTIEIVDSLKFPVTSLEKLTSIKRLTLDNQPMVLTSTIQLKIEGLILKNSNIQALLNINYDSLKTLVIEGCNILNTIYFTAANIESIKIKGTPILQKLIIKGAQKGAGAGAIGAIGAIGAFIGLTKLKSLEIESVIISKLDIDKCPALGLSEVINGQNVVNQVVLPTTLTHLNITGECNFETAIQRLDNLNIFIMISNTKQTNITLPNKITSCTITNSSIISLNTQACKNNLEILHVTECTDLTRLGDDTQPGISFTDYSALTNLTVGNTKCTAIVLTNCRILDSLNLNNNPITNYTVNNLHAIKNLTIPDTVTSVKTENMNALTTITYTGTEMTSFDVETCPILAIIPDFKTNTVNMTLLKVSNCPYIKPDLVAYLRGVGSAKANLVPGGSKNKSRKVSGGMNNKSRRNKRLLRGGVFESIGEVNFSNTGAIINNVQEFIEFVTNKKIQKIFVPESVKNKIETEKLSNAFIDALKTQHTDKSIAIDQITNVEISPEESYSKKRDAIIEGLKGVFTQIATQEAARVAAENAAKEKAEADRVAAENAAKEEADRVAAENAAKEKAEADRVAAENAAKDKAEADRVAAENATKEKAEADRVAAENAAKEEADRIAAENAAKEKAEADRVAAENAAKEEADRIAAENAAKEKAEADRVAAENAAKEEADRIAAENAAKEKAEADRVAAENAAKEEADRIAAENAAKEKAEADRVAAENAAKEEADRIAAENAAKEKAEADGVAAENAAKEEADRIAAENAAKEKAEADRVAAENAAKEEAERVAAENAAKEKAEADRVAAKEEENKLGKLWICNIKTTLGFKGRTCYGDDKEGKGFTSNITKIGESSILTVGNNAYHNLLYVGNDNGAGQNTDQHFFIQGDRTKHIFFKAEPGKRDEWVLEIQKAFKLKPLFVCNDSKCEKTTLGRITKNNSIELYKYNLENKEEILHTYKKISSVKLLDTDETSNYQGNSELAIKIEYQRENTIRRGTTPTTQILQTNTAENREYWIEKINEIINASSNNASSSISSSSISSDSNQIESASSFGKRGGSKQSDSKQSDSKRGNQNKSNKKRGGKGFRATRKKIRRKPKELVTKSATH
jgi:hypothetical protein